MGYTPLYKDAQGKGSARSLSTNYMNGTLGTILKGTLVSTDASGNMIPTDIANEDSVHAIIGITSMDVPFGAMGSLADGGRLENITTSFAIKDAIYLNYDNTLTNVKPDISVPGFVSNMWCVFIGVIVKNEFNPLLKDIKLMITPIAQM